MPINYGYEGPLAKPAVNIAQGAGYAQGVANARRFAAQQQLAYDQMAQSRYAQMMNIWSQQQAQQAASQRQQMQNVYDRQMAQQQASEQAKQYAQQQSDKMAYQDQQFQNQMKMGKAGAGWDLEKTAYGMRAKIGEAIGGLDPSKLSDIGSKKLSELQNELDIIDRGMKSGESRPADYFHALGEIQGRMSQFKTPEMYRVPRDKAAEVDEGTFIDPEGRRRRWSTKESDWVPDPDAPWAFAPDGTPTGTLTVLPNGSVGLYDPKTRLPVTDEANGGWNAAKHMAAIQTDIEDKMQKSMSSYLRDSGGNMDAADESVRQAIGAVSPPNIPLWVSDRDGVDTEDPQGRSHWEVELDKRVQNRFLQLQEIAFRGLPNRPARLPYDATSMASREAGFIPGMQPGAPNGPAAPGTTPTNWFDTVPGAMQQGPGQPTQIAPGTPAPGAPSPTQAPDTVPQHPGQQPVAGQAPTSTPSDTHETFSAYRVAFAGDKEMLQKVGEGQNLIVKNRKNGKVLPLEYWSDTDRDRLLQILAEIKGKLSRDRSSTTVPGPA